MSTGRPDRIPERRESSQKEWLKNVTPGAGTVAGSLPPPRRKSTVASSLSRSPPSFSSWLPEERSSARRLAALRLRFPGVRGGPGPVAGCGGLADPPCMLDDGERGPEVVAPPQFEPLLVVAVLCACGDRDLPPKAPSQRATTSVPPRPSFSGSRTPNRVPRAFVPPRPSITSPGSPKTDADEGVGRPCGSGRSNFPASRAARRCRRRSPRRSCSRRSVGRLVC